MKHEYDNKFLKDCGVELFHSSDDDVSSGLPDGWYVNVPISADAAQNKELGPFHTPSIALFKAFERLTESAIRE